MAGRELEDRPAFAVLQRKRSLDNMPKHDFSFDAMPSEAFEDERVKVQVKEESLKVHGNPTLPKPPAGEKPARVRRAISIMRKTM